MRSGTFASLGTTALLLLPVCAAAGEITIASGGRSEYRIVLPAGRHPAARYAAEELQANLEAICGARLPIVSETRAGVGPAVLIGPSHRAIETGLVEQARDLGEDGVLLKTVGEDLVLLGGGDRGQLYAVTELLERYLGCRFLAPDCTVRPERPTLTLPEIDFRYTPPFLYREELYHEAVDWAFAARLKLNGSNLAQCLGLPVSATGERIPGVLICPFAHSASAMVPPGQYFAEHPEYFGLVAGQRRSQVTGGQLCYTNPDVLRICTDWVLDWIANNPTVSCVDISQNDAYPGDSGACECEACRAVVAEEGAEHGPILRFVNAIADRVAEKYPDKYVDTLAYAYTIARPKHERPRNNVVIRLCHHACYFHGIEGCDLGAPYRQAVEEWRPVSKNLWIWHYGTNFWHYLAPNPNLEPLARDLRYYAEKGVNGVMLQGNIQSVGGELSNLRMYLTAQLLWDPTRDPMEIRREFCEGYYGPAAGEVLEFLGLMDAWGAAIPAHIPMNGWNPPDVTTPEFVAAASAVLERALARCDDPTTRNRVEKLCIPIWYMRMTWPEAYGVTKEQGRAIVADFRRVVTENGITNVSEWNPDMAGYLAGREAAFAGE